MAVGSDQIAIGPKWLLDHGPNFDHLTRWLLYRPNDQMAVGPAIGPKWLSEMAIGQDAIGQ